MVEQLLNNNHKYHLSRHCDALDTKGNFEFDRHIKYCPTLLALDFSRKE